MKKALIPLAIISFAVLSSCTSIDTIRPAMETLKGKKAHTAFEVLGFPDQEQSIAGRRVYVWEMSHQGSYITPTTTTATTYVNNQYVTTNVYGTRTNTYDASCKIRVIADAANTILDWDAEGNEFGCSYYAEKLRKIAPKK
jgi:hypothetical protein